MSDIKTDKSYLIEVLRERYEYEQFRRNNYDNLLTLPVTVLALLIGGLAALVSQDVGISDVIRYSTLVAMLPIGTSIYYLARVFYGASRDYKVLPSAKDINDHYEKLCKYHEELNDPSKRTHLSFQDDLIKWYNECSKANCEINDRRMKYFHKSKIWLIISLVAIFILLLGKIILNI